MPDYVWYYPIDQALGTVENSVGTVTTLTQDSFSPGLWAGMDDGNICINSKIYSVVYVHLNLRIIILDRPCDATHGDLIFSASILNRETE